MFLGRRVSLSSWALLEDLERWEGVDGCTMVGKRGEGKNERKE